MRPRIRTDAEHEKGCRFLTQYHFVEKIVQGLKETQRLGGLVSGAAKGVDTLARIAGQHNGLPVLEFPVPDGPEPFAVRAHRRNGEIVAHANMLIAIFATGPRSPGTSDSLAKALAKGIPTYVFHEGRWTQE